MTKQGPFSRLKTLSIFLFLALVVTYIFGIFVIIILPIPGIFLILHNRRWVWGMGGIIVLAALLLGLGDSQVPLLILIQTYTLITILIFIGLDHRWKPQKTIFRCTLIGFLAVLVGFGLFIVGSETVWSHQPLEEIESRISSWVEEYEHGLNHYREIKGAKDQLSWIRQNRAVIVQTLMDILPAVLIGILFLSIFMNFFIIQFFWFQSKDQLQERPLLEEWHIHDLWIWIIVLSLVLILTKISSFRMIAWNLLLMMATIYLSQGIAIFIFFINRIKIGLKWKIILFAFAFLIAYFYLVLIFIGLFDTWIDLRKLRPKTV